MAKKKGFVKANTMRESTIEDMEKMQERVRGAKKLRKNKWYTFYQTKDGGRRAVRMERKLLERYPHHAMFMDKWGRKECFTYQEIALLTAPLKKSAVITEEERGDDWE